MYYYQQPNHEDDERQQFDFPGFFDFISGGSGSGGNQSFPGYGPSPGGGQHGFPDGHHGPSPGGPPSFPGGQGFPGGGQSASAPTTPPPSFTPQQPKFQTFAVDPGAIRGCLYRFTYIWLNRDSFWFFPVFIGRTSVSGFRWSRNRWVYYGIDLNRVQSFQCF